MPSDFSSTDTLVSDKLDFSSGDTLVEEAPAAQRLATAPSTGPTVEEKYGAIKPERPLTIAEKLEDFAPSIFGPRGEQLPGTPPKGVLPNIAQVVYGKKGEPGLPDQPGLINFSPADVIPKQEMYSLELARQIASQINLGNVGIIGGLTKISKIANPKVQALAKAAISAYFAKQGAEVAGTSAGQRAGTPDMTQQQAAESDFNTAMGLLMAGAPALHAGIENAAVKSFEEPPIGGLKREIRTGSKPTEVTPPVEPVDPAPIAPSAPATEVAQVQAELGKAIGPKEVAPAPPIVVPEKQSQSGPEAGPVGTVDQPIPPVNKKKHPTLPGTEDPGEVLGFGGSRSKTPAADPAPPVPANQEQLTALVKQYTPGSGIVSGIKRGIQSLLFPSAMSPDHLRFAEKLGKHLGAMHRRAEVSRHATTGAERMFTKLGVDRDGVAPKDNPGIKFMSDMSQGADIAPKFKPVADLIQKLFGERLQKLQEVGAPIQTARENYFPGMWTKESRRAFNAAMDEATAKGTFGKGFDVNNSTPEQRAAIKARVDEFLDKGIGSDKDSVSYLSRRPMKGTETFRKPKVFDDIMDAAEFGLRPISNNPIDLVRLKLAEMDRSIMANGWFQELKANWNLKIISPYEKAPGGWVKVNDKYGTIYGKPTVTVAEHVDKAVYEGLVEFADKLGIDHKRAMQFPPGQGTRALGLSYQGQNLVRTKFATETSVLAHEIGHQLDHKYDLWNEITGGEKGNERKSQIQKDLRVIADMTGGRTGKTRTKLEKIAQMVEAYVHAPERMAKEAPLVFSKFDAFIKSRPELKGMADIKPGIELTKLTGEKYVGLPIMGYRIVPEAAGAIMNNYLSSSLYNSPHFGTLYKAWMGTANALNQSQLGWGSAFHAGFTTGEAQVSAGANVIKDVFGILRGNRNVKDLAASAGKSATASVRTAIVGNDVLNAWRDPNGRMTPKVAQVVKAAELAGGGFKMESGLRTMQSEKAYRDWYSGHRVRAAARSPIAALELAAKPIMDWLVPRQKAGVFAELAGRIIDQNPSKALEELTPEFRQAWNRIDARLGQVRYDRLFMNNVAKNVIQGAVRAPGWSGGTIAELGGGFKDAAGFISEWVRTGKLPENIPDRTAYLISLVLTVGAANAVLTYTLTGKQPQGMDYWAFRTGKKDESGRDERMMLPTYMKDVMAYWKSPGQTLLNKSHPLISMFSDLAKNRDYYGVEIRDKEAGALKQAGQAAGYVVKAFEPFWTRGARKESSREAGAARTALPFVGIMPAPPKINNTAAENLASELLHRQFGDRTVIREQFERTKARKEEAAKIKRGEDTVGGAVSKGIITRQQSKSLQKQTRLPYLDYAVIRLSAKSAVDVYAEASTEERKRIRQTVSGKIERATSLNWKDKAQLRARLTELDGKQPASASKPTPTPFTPNPSFNPYTY